MRKTIAALQVSVDGFIEGPNGELDWAMTEDEETWQEALDEMLASVDTLILGRVMYPAYEQYWLAILADPTGILPFSGRVASKSEIAYARRADRSPTSSFQDPRQGHWQTTRIVRDVEEIRKMKTAPGKDMYVVGGATLVSSLMNLDLLDELRLMVNPLILGGGKALFKDVKGRHGLSLVRAKPLASGKVSLIYRMQT